MSMSTPIHQLPASAPPSHPPTDDPEVLSMLSEMDKEVEEATLQQHQPMMRTPPVPTPSPQMHMPVVKKAPQKKLWDQDVAQKAIIYAVIAMVVFYPATLRFLYSKLPKFESVFNSYDFIIRTALLAIVLYAALTFLPF